MTMLVNELAACGRFAFSLGSCLLVLLVLLVAVGAPVWRHPEAMTSFSLWTGPPRGVAPLVDPPGTWHLTTTWSEPHPDSSRFTWQLTFEFAKSCRTSPGHLPIWLVIPRQRRWLFPVLTSAMLLQSQKRSFLRKYSTSWEESLDSMIFQPRRHHSTISSVSVMICYLGFCNNMYIQSSARTISMDQLSADSCNFVHSYDFNSAM